MFTSEPAHRSGVLSQSLSVEEPEEILAKREKSTVRHKTKLGPAAAAIVRDILEHDGRKALAERRHESSRAHSGLHSKDAVTSNDCFLERCCETFGCGADFLRRERTPHQRSACFCKAYSAGLQSILMESEVASETHIAAQPQRDMELRGKNFYTHTGVLRPWLK